MRLCDKYSLTADVLACMGVAIFIFSVFTINEPINILTLVCVGIIGMAALLKHHSIQLYKTSKEN